MSGFTRRVVGAVLVIVWFVVAPIALIVYMTLSDSGEMSLEEHRERIERELRIESFRQEYTRLQLAREINDIAYQQELRELLIDYDDLLLTIGDDLDVVVTGFSKDHSSVNVSRVDSLLERLWDLGVSIREMAVERSDDRAAILGDSLRIIDSLLAARQKEP
ncbi:MAG: hypothetical protein AB1744_12710 [Candidatus Zixiibacteriota bacterium]